MSQPKIALDDLLAPISGDAPAGRDLRYDPSYGEIEEARRSEDDAPQGDIWQRKTKASEWDKVVKIGSECLAKKSKDLMIAAWMTEALAHRHEFAGLRDGFRLMHGIQENFWNSYFPQVEDGELETRHRPFAFLNTERILPFVIRTIPITEGVRDQNYSLSRYTESRATTNVGLKSSDDKEALLAEGKIDAEMFDDAVSQTPRSFYESLSADFDEARAAFLEFKAATDARFGDSAPSLTNIRKALDEAARVVGQIVAQKRGDEPHASEPEPGEDVAEESESAESEESPRRPAATPKRARRSSSGPIETVDDARERIAQAADALRRLDPGDPASYLVVRALRMSRLYALSDPSNASELPCPSSETRQELRRLVAEENWAAAMEEAESALARDEGVAWLDPHRVSLMAKGQIYDGVDYAGAQRASQSFLKMILADFPDLPRAGLADDTNAASDATRSWIADEVAPPPPEPAVAEEPAYIPRMPPPPVESNGEAYHEPDAWDLALEDVRAGSATEGLQRLQREVARASHGREKFVRKLQLAELCLMVRNTRIASPLLEELARLVDVFRLEEWESDELCARVWSGLYRCLLARGADAAPPGRLQEVYTRLCRLDIEQAMAMGEDAG